MNRFTQPNTQGQHRTFIVSGVQVCIGTVMFRRQLDDPAVNIKLENVDDAVEYVLNWRGTAPLHASFLDIVAKSVGVNMSLLVGGLHALTRHEGVLFRVGGVFFFFLLFFFWWGGPHSANIL
jgi:hypothetical protein